MVYQTISLSQLTNLVKVVIQCPVKWLSFYPQWTAA